MLVIIVSCLLFWINTEGQWSSIIFTGESEFYLIFVLCVLTFHFVPVSSFWAMSLRCLIFFLFYFESPFLVFLCVLSTFTIPIFVVRPAHRLPRPDWFHLCLVKLLLLVFNTCDFLCLPLTLLCSVSPVCPCFGFALSFLDFAWILG